jgi:DNA-binding CsgD family transcriptional regulator
VQGFLAGNFTISAEANEGLRLAVETGLDNAASLFRACLGWLAAVRGDRGACRQYVAAALEVSVPHRHGIANAIADWTLALLDLGTGRPDDAAERLQRMSGVELGLGHEFYELISAPDLVEAQVRSGRPESALATYEHFSRALGPGASDWFLSLGARCRALLAEGSAAESLFEEALTLHTGGNPFDRARTELLYGEHLRRERRRQDARSQLRSALRTFDLLGATVWAERAGAELRATGETARKRDPSAVNELTPQELQIARLVAEGGSNKDVAARLFLSPRTVEYHLRKVFSKLGIASRAELIRLGIGEAREVVTPGP